MRASLTIAFLLVAGCERALPPGWVYVTAVTRTAATVVWTGRGNERVACRDAGGRAVAAPERPRARGLFIARLDGLQPATGYSCRIIGDVARYPPLHFRTAPP